MSEQPEKRPMSVAEAGRRGGEPVKSTYGTEYYPALEAIRDAATHGVAFVVNVAAVAAGIALGVQFGTQLRKRASQRRERLGSAPPSR